MGKRSPACIAFLHFLMPDSVRESLATDAGFYLEMAKQGKKGPIPKELRMMSMLHRLFRED